MEALAEASADDTSRLKEIQKTVDQIRQTLGSIKSPEPNVERRFQEVLSIPEELWARIYQERILSSLAFPEMHERFELVTQAHLDTFEWMFPSKNIREDQSTSKRHIELHNESKVIQASLRWIDWLRSPKILSNETHWQELVFHISGKLGSGKSTLMKFLYQNRVTRKELEFLAGECLSFDLCYPGLLEYVTHKITPLASHLSMSSYCMNFSPHLYQSTSPPPPRTRTYLFE